LIPPLQGQICSAVPGKYTYGPGVPSPRVSRHCPDWPLTSNNETAPGTNVELWPCNGGANQKWTVDSNGTIVGQQSGLCLDVTGGSTTQGTPLEIWTCNGQSNQQWSWAYR
jgi:Ricin-type beta-trefoil lectin domain